MPYKREPDGRLIINPFWKFTRWRFARRLNNYDIWHYQFPVGALKRWVLIHSKDHLLVKHYNGSDLRGKFENDACIVSTPDLLAYAPNGTWIRDPLDIAYVSQFKMKVVNRIPKVAHYPYYLNDPHKARDEEIYGPALRKLERKGKCEVVSIIRLPYEKALGMLSKCDLVIGKVMPKFGWFSKFELEGMLLGKPVIAFVRDDLFEKYRPPLFNTRKETFESDLETLLEDRSCQERLSSEGSKYVAINHDAKTISAQVERFYQKLI